jgi:hypothetical protein
MYWLIAWSLDIDRPKSIGRLIGVDQTGILYIGSTRSMLRRCGTELCEAMLVSDENFPWSSKQRSFMYDYFHSHRVQHEISRNSLRLCYFETSLEQEAQTLEQQCIIKYRNFHGEPPPFNRDIPYHHLTKDNAQVGPLTPEQLGNEGFWPHEPQRFR